MKLLHLSDIHFGMENYSRINPVTGLQTRLEDFAHAFDRAIIRAFDEGVDAVIFTGDAYKTRDPNPTVQREFAKRVQKLATGGIPVFLLTGNHDLPNMQSRAHSIEIFDTLGVPNISVAQKIELKIINTRSGPLQIVSIPWLTRANLLTKEEYRTHTLEELNELLIERIGEALQHQVRKLDPAIPAILAVHASIYGANYGSERAIMLGQDLVLQKSLLETDHFDYVAVGHIHKHQDLSNGVPIIYPGSIERIDFGEEKEDKGFVMVEIDGQGGSRASRRTDWYFQPDKLTRPFRTLDLDITMVEADDLLNPTSAALQALQRETDRLDNKLDGAIVRLRLKLRPDQEPSLREEELRRSLNELGTYYIAALQREVDRPRRTRLAGQSVEALTPIELLDRYFESKAIDPRRREILLKHAAALINGSSV